MTNNTTEGTNMTTYTTTGEVRGECGHTHRTYAAALACVSRDRRDCASLGGGAYSDRHVVEIDGSTDERQESDEEHAERLTDEACS